MACKYWLDGWNIYIRNQDRPAVNTENHRCYPLRPDGQDEFITIPVFNLSVPVKIEGVDDNILDPGKAWDTSYKWHIAAADLAMKFILNFSKFAINEEAARLAESGPRI